MSSDSVTVKVNMKNRINFLFGILLFLLSGVTAYYSGASSNSGLQVWGTAATFVCFVGSIILMVSFFTSNYKKY